MLKPSDFNTSEIKFDKQRGGYDRQQVDRYIQLLSSAYEQTGGEYAKLCKKYNSLLNEYNRLKNESAQSSPREHAVTKAIIDAEMTAQKIIAAAQAEAGKIDCQLSINLNYRS